MASLQGHLRRLFWLTREHQTHHVDEHARLLEAILTRQADLAERLAREHIQETAADTLKLLSV
jgi:DNA-binding GntR family transcriptional regulator